MNGQLQHKNVNGHKFYLDFGLHTLHFTAYRRNWNQPKLPTHIISTEVFEIELKFQKLLKLIVFVLRQCP